MESALQLPEVLSTIINHADGRTQTSAARTSKMWSEAALDVIWRDLDSVMPLLKLLAPLRRIPYPSMWELEHLPTVDAWERFQTYAPRVRALTYHDEVLGDAREHTHLSVNVWMDLAAMVPGMVPLLPNLRKLEWHIVRADSPFSLVFLFLSHNLRHLALEIDVTDVSPASFNHFLQHLPIRSPSLTHFNLYTQVVSRDIQTELSKCITRLRSLKVVGLPPCYHTDVIVQALAVAPALIEMRTGWLAAQPPTPEESQVEFKEGWFRSVERVDLELPPLRAILLITDPYRPRSLSRLRLTTGTLSDHDHLERFLSAVATTLPELKLLSLNLWGPHTPAPTPVPFNTFRPALACRQMKTFEVGHNHPVQLDEADINAMAEAWPNLAELTFCEDPVLTGNTSPGLSLSVLPLFAEKFPALKELGLFLDGAPVPPFTAPPIFNNLIELNVGTSRLDSRHATANALYISDLCRHPVTIIKGKSAWHVSGVWDLEEDDTPYLSGSSAWAEVGRTIKAVHTHRQEREKRRAEDAKRQATAITLAVEQLTKGVETVQGSGALEEKVKELEAALRVLQTDLKTMQP